ncbi:MAG TPA: enoyl-CoA hydratase/isomerase family protein [Candidatus Dormibacteraeota bacterium]|nr:enoyl-CoA hydratase/isomerase family protein [Candidatus Dormibacteraeota bacterium]
MTIETPEPTQTQSDVLYEVNDRVATITFNRPHAYNAYTTDTLARLHEAFRRAMWDDEVGVVVLTGAGRSAFCTGGDVKEYAEYYVAHPEQFRKYMVRFQDCLDAIRQMGKPTIARLNGMAVGGGNEFNMACDLAVAADHITIRQVGARVGSVAAGGGTQWLPIMVGDRRAREMLFLCEPIGAAQALDWGLVNRVVPYDDLDATVREMSDKLLEKFPDCLSYTQCQVNYWKDQAWYATIGHAREWLALHFGHEETAEGMRAFVEKRKPDYAEVRRRRHP